MFNGRPLPPPKLPEINIEHQPEYLSVDKEIIYAARIAVNNALEYATECLTTHDATLGRTTLKNKTWAEHIEQDIRNITTTLNKLNCLIDTR